jgi:hypothetical protein
MVLSIGGLKMVLVARSEQLPYEIVGMYIKNKEEFDSYLAVRQKKLDENRALIEEKFNQSEIRKRTLSRQQD